MDKIYDNKIIGKITKNKISREQINLVKKLELCYFSMYI
jgi:hypothetical protein